MEEDGVPEAEAMPTLPGAEINFLGDSAPHSGQGGGGEEALGTIFSKRWPQPPQTYS